MVITSIILICCLVEGSQRFFLDLKLCLEKRGPGFFVKPCLYCLIGTEMDNIEMSYLNLVTELRL